MNLKVLGGLQDAPGPLCAVPVHLDAAVAGNSGSGGSGSVAEARGVVRPTLKISISIANLGVGVGVLLVPLFVLDWLLQHVVVDVVLANRIIIIMILVVISFIIIVVVIVCFVVIVVGIVLSVLSRHGGRVLFCHGLCLFGGDDVVGDRVSAPVELRQVQEIGGVGCFGRPRSLCVVHAISQILVEKVLVPVRESESVSNLVAARV
mmetsp:Transcript_5489/g.13554  ORF Transcript_5489/g.13554 Transcript_5489/m.13554 type:complete len:206 (+) Transcript_5489:385-1002(+)